MNLLTVHRRATGRRAPVPMLGLALAVVLLASLLAPPAGYSQGAAAADEPAATDEATAVLQDEGTADAPTMGDQGDGGAEETPVVEETPVAEETPDAGLAAAQEDPWTSGISVSMRECATAYDGTFLQLLANCWVSPIAFDVYGGGVLQESAQGDFAVTGLPAGQYTIREYLPQGYGKPLAFCGVAPTGELIEPVQVVTYDGYYEFALGEDQSIACYWFHVVANVASDEVAIHLTARTCPANVDADNADFAALSGACQGIEPVWFVVTDGFGSELGSGTTDGSGQIAFDYLPPGALKVAGQALAGYGAPVVHCNLTDANGQQSGYEAWPVWPGGGAYVIDAALNGGEVLACAWFHVPHRQQPDVPAADGEVVVYVWDCPAGYDTRPSLASLWGSCTAAEQLIAFHLTDAAGGDAERTAKLGRATWDGVAAGEYGIRADLPAGSGQPVVFCGLAMGEENWLPEPWPVADGAIAFSHEGDGWVFVCDWFNVPDDSQLTDGGQAA